MPFSGLAVLWRAMHPFHLANESGMPYYICERQIMTRPSHDSFYKQIYSRPEMVRDLLVDFVPEDFVADMDFSTLERLNS